MAFLDDTFAKSTATKEQCLNNKTGAWDGVFQVAHKKDFGHVPYQNEYTGEVLNMTDDMWQIPPSANTIWENPYYNFWLSWRYSNFKFQERGPGVGTHTAKCSKCEGESITLPLVRLRGLCVKSKFDKKYSFGDDNVQGIYFQGERGTNITTNMTQNELDKGPNKFALIHTSLESNHTIEVRQAWVDSPEGTFLLGRQQMKIDRDED